MLELVQQLDYGLRRAKAVLYSQLLFCLKIDATSLDSLNLLLNETKQIFFCDIYLAKSWGTEHTCALKIVLCVVVSCLLNLSWTSDLFLH